MAQVEPKLLPRDTNTPKMFLQPGLRPEPRGEAHSVFRDPLAGFGGFFPAGWEGK